MGAAIDFARLPFRSVYAALSWAVAETARLDGVRASGSVPPAGAIYKPGNAHADRLLLLAIIWDAVGRVPSRYRRALLLAVSDGGMSAVEIGGVLGCSDRWVRVLLQRGRVTLERRLRRRGVVK
jgi:DNA-directed RNA polymerase specialized sigma24 family protein